MAGGYFLYMVVLWMPFFPFLNITGLFICIGIGADDIFVFLEALDLASRTHGASAPIEQILTTTLYDAGAATLVTSLTTGEQVPIVPVTLSHSFTQASTLSHYPWELTAAGAFASTIVSPITSIKCFGIFCALVVVCDWLLMIVYLPGLCVIYRKCELTKALHGLT